MSIGTPFRLIAFFSAAGFVLAACGGTNSTSSTAMASPDKQIYRANDVTEPNSYDPGQQTYTYEGAVGRNVFEPLLKPKADLSDVQPATAESYSVSSDGLTYTFHLQPAAKWSDGQPVTASDFVYGWQRLLNPALAAGYADPFFDGTVSGGQNYGTVDATSSSAIDSYLQALGLSAPDPHTFVVKLQHAAPYFKWVATLWVGAPIRKDVVEKAAGGPFPSNDATKAEIWANNVSTIIGNGPFKLSEIVAKDHATMVPNTNYWGGTAKIQQVVLEFIPDGNTSFSKYQTGALDQINVPQADVTYVRNDPTLSKQAYLWPELTDFWMTYNWHVSPLDNKDVRLALAKSIDRDKLANDVLHGTVKATLSFIPKGMTGYDESDKTQSFDVAAAKADLAASGVSVADLSKLKLLTRNSTGSKLVNQFIVAQWNTNLGTNIQLDVIDSKTVTTRIRKADFDIYGADGWGADYPDQQDWYDVYTSAACHGLNWGCPVLPGYDAIVQKADTELDQNQRNKDYAAARKILMDSAAIGMLYQQYEYDLVKPYVGNLQVTPFDDEWLPGDQNYVTAYIKQH
jgi:oligopeptide transport system substrate-binding protein